MKILKKKPGEKTKVTDVPDFMITSSLNAYLSKKNMPKVTSKEIDIVKESIRKAVPKDELFVLAEIRHKDGSIIKVVF